uniref:N-terminal methionine N(alpha)-acetyltransferase NatC n=1 Tax=Daphnia magna TaxID=35525 RepID=A0A4Y7MKS3_9CRUS|nr:EOG090X07BN [Daphnia magna]SVE80157.1 EOG090X07BN [Daphnia magna]SVE80763.1 EOG090X07BN [Daphnia magna]SVE81355.1 EOG090X07BN [Daphnia magna]SVE82527.1 EOG090X07BN [Daphnia magna]
MAPKKKPNKPFNNHQTSDPGLVSKINLNNEATDSTSKNHKLNGHILNDKQMVGDESSELQMPDIMRLIQKDLSEPYSIYTYRYFIHNWPMLCYLAMYGEKCVGAIVCKLDVHKKVVRRGYIAMLAVDEKYRQEKIGSNLVMKAIAAMVADGADEVVLETEITNEPALRLYENLGFVRDKRLFRYYLNGVDALRLKLWLR